MPLSQEQTQKLSKLAEFVVIEMGYKLSSLINKNASFEYLGPTESKMNSAKILIKKDSFFVQNRVADPDLGPFSLIVSNPQVFTIADLVMGGDGISTENTKPDETNQMVYAETLNQVFKSLFIRFGEYADLTVKLGEHSFKELISIKDATLEKPEGVEDPIALKFKIKISAKLDEELHLEINSRLLEFILEKLDPILAELKIEDFKNKVKSSYAPEEKKEEEVKNEEPEEDLGDDSYKVNEKRNLSFLTDINLDLVVELGRSEMMLNQLLNLTKGSAIELERQCNEPVDLYAHNQLIARGEVVAIDDCFGLKITEVLGDLKLAQKLGLSLK